MDTQVSQAIQREPQLATAVENKVILHGIHWQTYEDLLAQNEGNSGVHFAYDRGNLEIMTLSPRHERLKHVLSLLVEVLAAQLGIEVIGFGSTTFRRSDLARGFEPDACFYIAHANQMREQETVDLHSDPPPDLLIEIDITHFSLNKFPIFQALAIPEVWRYDGEFVSIYHLQGKEYTAQRYSLAFPNVTTHLLTTWMEDCSKLKRREWIHQIGEWANDNPI